jgi:ribosomal protein S19
MLGIRISVYNGVRFFSFTVDKGKLGYCVGEFAPTRKKPIQKKKKK